ncbi:EAL domain-containing protein [Pseudomonas canadensis]|uniref:EAL domain-containing protein n=1 Tax=Pseudomonas canadensis TaxID=915099 RepID=UPI002736D94D|nr:EAL domain-containing protein [Pseudomonas canadensis]WLH29943.1 EAL domain-containing protein [Pseudomonas canadensis]
MAKSVIVTARPCRARLVVLSSDDHYVQRMSALLNGNNHFHIEHLGSSNSLLTHLSKHSVDIIITQINAELMDGLMLPCWIAELNTSGRLQRVPHIVWTVQTNSTLGTSSLIAGNEHGWRTTLNGVSSTALASHARLAGAAGIQVEIVTEGQPDQVLQVLERLASIEHPLPHRDQPERVEQLLSEDDVVSVMATGEGLRVVLQPQYDLASRRVVGAEALVRWQHPRHGDVPPSLLIPMVNRLGLDLLLFSYIEKTVIEILGHLDRLGIDIPIAINASAHTLCASGLATRLAHKMHRAGLPTGRLKIELTEEMAADNELALSASITALRAKGFPVSLDDFGAGAATLALLSRMPFDEMKIDGALVRAVGQSPQSSEIIAGIVSLARLFNINLVTEGIEDIASLELLSRLGCKTGQGFALSRPMERNDFLNLITQ